MKNEDIENVNDRELFSELFNNLIHLLLIHMVPHFVDKKDPMCHLQINGEAIWKWREIYGHPSTAFDLLQRIILPLGYKLMEPSRERVGNVLAVRIRHFWQKIHGTTNGKRRKRLKAETWIKLAIKPEEIQHTPNDVVVQLMQQNSQLGATVEERAADLYDEMRHRLGHTGKEFQDVGKKQQHKHLAQIQ